MLRPGHASTMTLGFYNTPSRSSSPPSDFPAYTRDPPKNAPSQYLTIYLSNDDPTDTLFITDAGQKLYQSRTVPLHVRNAYAPIHLNHQQPQNRFRGQGTLSPLPPPSPSSSISSSSSSSHTHITLVTRVSRLYGSTARAIREAALKRGDRDSAAEGLLVAELEWLSRTGSSRIRFGDGLAVNKQNAVDVRVDEFLKSTNGRGFSKMFATSDGRAYKWKTDTSYSEPAHLVECDSGRRVSEPLVTFHFGTGQLRGGAAVEMERRDDAGIFGERVLGNEMPPSSSFLRVATRLLPVIDQILVSWVIMEKERRSMAMAPLGSPLNSSSSSSFPSPSSSTFSSSSSSSGSSGWSSPSF